MKILVTGGCSLHWHCAYKSLLKLGHKVISVDKQWFGNYLKNKNLTNLKLVLKIFKKFHLKASIQLFIYHLFQMILWQKLIKI